MTGHYFLVDLDGLVIATGPLWTFEQAERAQRCHAALRPFETTAILGPVNQ